MLDSQTAKAVLPCEVDPPCIIPDLKEDAITSETTTGSTDVKEDAVTSDATTGRTSWRKKSSDNVLDAGLKRSFTESLNFSERKKSSVRVGRTSLMKSHTASKLLDLANASRAKNMNPITSGKEPWMISPNAPLLRKWDPLVMGALMFTALVTPYEVALLETSFNLLFVVNRLIDMIFVFDMALQFMVIQEVHTPDGMLIIKTRGALAKKYFHGWFFVDFVSILPFDLIGFFSGSDDISKMKSVRLIRLARLLKLLRIVRASRIMARWQTRISISFGVQKISSCFAGLLVASHWMACLWALVGKESKDRGEYSWIDKVMESKQSYQMDSHWSIYLAAAHVSVTTIKATHGWAFPQNDLEYYMGILSQWFGGLIWTYTIGRFCGVFANLSPDKIRFQQNMDSLNRMMEHKSMPREIRYKLRQYFFQARDLHMNNSYKHLLEQMSPMLQAEVAHNTNKRWLVKVWYLAACSDQFAAQVCRHMAAAVFCPREIVSQKIPQLSIVSRGLVGRLGRVLRKGAVFGEDLILKDKKLRKDVTTIAMTYAEILSIDQATFMKVVDQASTRDAAEVRWGVVRLAVIRGIPVLADELWKDKALLQKLLDGQHTSEAQEAHLQTNGGAVDVAPTAAKAHSPSFGNDGEVVSGLKSDSFDLASQSHNHSVMENQVVEKLSADVREIKQFQYQQSQRQEKLSNDVQEIKRLLQALSGVAACSPDMGQGVVAQKLDEELLPAANGAWEEEGPPNGRHTSKDRQLFSTLHSELT